MVFISLTALLMTAFATTAEPSNDDTQITAAVEVCEADGELATVDFNIMDSGHSLQVEESIDGLTETMGLHGTECITHELSLPEWLFAQMAMTPLQGKVVFEELTVSWSSAGENGGEAFVLFYDTTVGGGPLGLIVRRPR